MLTGNVQDLSKSSYDRFDLERTLYDQHMRRTRNLENIHYFPSRRLGNGIEQDNSFHALHHDYYGPHQRRIDKVSSIRFDDPDRFYESRASMPRRELYDHAGRRPYKPISLLPSATESSSKGPQGALNLATKSPVLNIQNNDESCSDNNDKNISADSSPQEKDQSSATNDSGKDTSLSAE